MTEHDRQEHWKKIDQLQAKIDEAREYVDDPECTCGDHECDDCAWIEAYRRDLGDYQSQKRKLVAQFPEMREAQ